MLDIDVDVNVKQHVTMHIGELAHRSGVSRRALRYYEQQGLLSPERRSNGYREYGPEAPEIVGKITNLIRSGLSTELIRDILPCMTDPSLRIDLCDALVVGLSKVRARMDSQIECLESSRAAVDRLLTNSVPSTV